MNVIRTKNYKEMSQVACEILINEIKKKPGLKIGFATGKTPIGLYKELVKAYKKRKVSFSRVKAFNLDEYYPMNYSDNKSFRHYLLKNLISKINIKKSKVRLFDSATPDPDKECRIHDRMARNADVLILGVGVNGHIAFNEPRSSFKSKTRLVDLSYDTLRRNKVMKDALTIGISTILSSKKIILLASGYNKSKAVRHLIKGKKSEMWPVSALKRHKNLIVILDNIKNM